MSKFELENLKNVYLFNNSRETKGLCFPFNEFAITEVIDAFCECVNFERPDGYCIYKDTLYIFEHFAIDSSVQMKGSSYMRKKHQSNDVFEQFKSSKGVKNIQMVTVEESLDDYVANFQKIVGNHYKKISEYKTNVISIVGKDSFKDIKIVFVGENPLPLGVRVVRDSSIIEMIPLLYRNFLYDLLEYKNIDYFLFFNHGLNNDFVTGIDMKYIENDYKLAAKINKNSIIESDYIEIQRKLE